jgi:hypothetical protein
VSTLEEARALFSEPRRFEDNEPASLVEAEPRSKLTPMTIGHRFHFDASKLSVSMRQAAEGMKKLGEAMRGVAPSMINPAMFGPAAAKQYRMTGSVRSDGKVAPVIRGRAGQILWRGTLSKDFQSFDVMSDCEPGDLGPGTYERVKITDPEKGKTSDDVQATFTGRHPKRHEATRSDHASRRTQSRRDRRRDIRRRLRNKGRRGHS